MLLPLLPHLMYVCFTVNVPAVVAGASVAFLLLLLLIAGIIIGLVLLRRVKKETSLEKLAERIECAEKRKQSPGKGRESAVGHSEQRTGEVAPHHERVELHEEDLHYESTDVLGQGCRGRVEGNGIMPEGHYYDVSDAAENAQSKEEVGDSNDQPKGTPNAVYAVVDKSKKKKQGKTRGGASATTTQGIYTEEQHYECSSVFGQDWLGNVAGEKPERDHGDVGQGDPSNDAKKLAHSLSPQHDCYRRDSKEVKLNS